MKNAGREIRRKIVHHDVQILQSGDNSENAYKNCPHGSRHESFFVLDDLSKHLSIKDKHLIEFIFIQHDLTGYLEVSSGDGIRCGTCFVQKVDFVTNVLCPCRECGGHSGKNCGKITVSTALHVIGKDTHNAKMCTVRLSYDRVEDQGQDNVLYGQSSHSHDVEGDWCALVCVTHNLELLNKLSDILTKYWKTGYCLRRKYENTGDNLVVIVSHPHGGPKLLSVGKLMAKNCCRKVRDDQEWCYYSYNTTTCDGCGGAAVYVLGKWNDGFGYWFNHSHNHSGVDNTSYNGSTVGIHSIYGVRTKPSLYSELDQPDNSEHKKPSLYSGIDQPDNSEHKKPSLYSGIDQPDNSEHKVCTNNNLNTTIVQSSGMQFINHLCDHMNDPCVQEVKEKSLSDLKMADKSIAEDSKESLPVLDLTKGFSIQSKQRNVSLESLKLSSCLKYRVDLCVTR